MNHPGFQWYRPLWAFLAVMLALLPLTAQAADYAAGAELNGNVATLWFKSNVNSAWVDAHFSVNGGAQQNVRMTYNSGTGRHETTFPGAAGQTVTAFFTYEKSGLAYDSPSAPYPLNGGGGGTVATPAFSVPGGTYAGAQAVAITSATAGATIRYTVDGSTPTAASPVLPAGSTVNVAATTTLKAYATASGLADSAVAAATYTINTGGGFTFTPGADLNGNVATIWFAPSAAIAYVDVHYTVNGGAQQNVRMGWNAAAGRYETSTTVTLPATLSGWFTYNITGATQYDSPTYSITLGQKAAMPTFAPPAGTYPAAQTVAIASTTAGATIRYTTDGSTPTSSSPAYSAPITVASTQTLKAVAFANGLSQSDVASAPYTIQPLKAANPTFTPPAGTYNTVQSVSLASATPGATIRYTTDGSTPTSSSPAYSAPITVAGSQTLTAITFANGLAPSDAVPAAYTILQTPAAAPTFTPPAGTYAAPQTVTLASTTPGAQIRYTTDGTTPTASSPLYAGPITVATAQTVKAVASAPGFSNSPVSSAEYKFSTAEFVQGVSELGATATVWIKPTAQAAFAILHYAVNQGQQINPKMTWNASLNRYETTVSPVAPGAVIAYWFTYDTPLGAHDSPPFTYKMGDGNNGVAKPAFTPAGGVFPAWPVAVTLATTEANAIITYTTDGSAPTARSPQYTGPITVSRAQTINAITVKADGSESAIASATYVLDDTHSPVLTPAFSLPSGTYPSTIAVNLLSGTPGATIYYTTDGSTPTAQSMVYRGPVWLQSSATVKAIAIKNGISSGVASASYIVGGGPGEVWNGLTTFSVVNGTKGKWPDNKVYWAIIGKDWATGNFVHVDRNGTLIPMALGDNGALVKNGQRYANYFYSLAEVKSITLPPINSARLLMSVGEPMYLQVNVDVNGRIAYAGANIENPTDPNIDVIFDFGEFAILPPGGNANGPQGIFVNTTRVDQFGFPLQLTVTGLDGFSQTVGESLTETRDELFAKYITSVPAEFRSLAQAPYAPYRIMAPAHGTFGKGGPNETYLDAYIDAVWAKYRNQDLVINLNNGWPTFTGRVVGDVFQFTDVTGGSYRINGKPTTSMVMLGNGLLDDPQGTTDAGKQLQLQAQVCAALNRHVADLTFDQWWNSAAYFPAGGAANHFVKFWHDHSLNALAYGFAYDDVGGYSPSIHTPKPKTVTYTIGW